MLIKDFLNTSASERKDESRSPYLLFILLGVIITSLTAFEQVTIFTDRLIGAHKYAVGILFVILFWIVAIMIITQKDSPNESGELFYHYPQSQRIVAKISTALLLLISCLMIVSAFQGQRKFPLTLEGVLNCPSGEPAVNYQVEIVGATGNKLSKDGSFITDGRGYFVILTKKPPKDADQIRFISPSGDDTTHSLSNHVLPKKNDTQNVLSKYTLYFCP
jgi:hypothetical protein